MVPQHIVHSKRQSKTNYSESEYAFPGPEVETDSPCFRLAALQQAGLYKHVRWPLHVSSANGMSKVRLAGYHFLLSRKGNNPRIEKSKESQHSTGVDGG